MGGSGRAGGITRVSENGDPCADRQAEQGAATDARSVGDDVAEFDGAAGGEMLTAFEKNSQYEHRESCDNASAPIPESDHRQRRQDQVSTEMLQLVPDVEAADGDHHGRRGGQQGTVDDAAHQHGPEGQDECAPRLRRETESRCGFVLLSKHAVNQWLPISVGGHRSWTLPGTRSKRFPFLPLDPGLPKDAHQQAATDVLRVRIGSPNASSCLSSWHSDWITKVIIGNRRRSS